jgi:hypothetical protein
MNERTWLRPTWLLNCRVAAGLLRMLLWVLLVAGVAVGVNIAGIHIVGGIDGWQRWLRANRGYFFAWRLFLYAATAYGWWWMRRRLLERAPSVEPHQRLRRVEIAALMTLVLLEGSQLLHSN